jgi:hypothetical protein
MRTYLLLVLLAYAAPGGTVTSAVLPGSVAVAVFVRQVETEGSAPGDAGEIERLLPCAVSVPPFITNGELGPEKIIPIALPLPDVLPATALSSPPFKVRLPALTPRLLPVVPDAFPPVAFTVPPFTVKLPFAITPRLVPVPDTFPPVAFTVPPLTVKAPEEFT